MAVGGPDERMLFPVVRLPQVGRTLRGGSGRDHPVVNVQGEEGGLYGGSQRGPLLVHAPRRHVGDGEGADPTLYADRDILMPNDNSLIVYSKHSSGSTSINSTVLYPADITMYLGATQVGMRFKRQIVAKTQSLTNFEFQLVGLADAPETLGLELGSDEKEITGDMKASFAGQNVSVLIFFNDQDNQRRSQHFDLHVYSTVRAAIFENKLSLSSKEALLSVKLEIPSLANSTFVKDELSTAHFSEADRVVHLLGVESMVNEQLKVLRYHSSKSESEVSSHSVITKVSDLLSPEVSLSHLGIESFLLANLRYNKYPTVTRKMSDLRSVVFTTPVRGNRESDENKAEKPWNKFRRGREAWRLQHNITRAYKAFDTCLHFARFIP